MSVSVSRLLLGLHADGRPVTAASICTCTDRCPEGSIGASLLDAVEQSELRGRGGAGFPTALKLRAVAGGRGRKVVLANGVEGEPPSGKDKVLLRYVPHLVLDGVEVAAHAVGADQAIVAVSAARRASSPCSRTRSASGAGADRIEIRIATVPDGSWPAKRPLSSTPSPAARPDRRRRRHDPSSAGSTGGRPSFRTSRRSLSSL